MAYFARPKNESGLPQLLKEHLQEVGRMAGDFAADIGFDRQLGEWAGWLHDLGKYGDDFQRHRLCLNPDGSAIDPPVRKRVEHAAHGACVAMEAGLFDVAAAIDAHHSALHDSAAFRDILVRDERVTYSPAPKVRARATDYMDRALADGSFAAPPRASQDLLPRDQQLDREMRTRMLLSCLADADRLDAEKWTEERKHAIRQRPPLMAARRLAAVRAFIGARAKDIAATETSAEVLRVRAEVLDDCLREAEHAPGFFSLTVPTGGGKTLASLAFALEHAATNSMRRVIVVVPFLAIIEQNAKVIREAIGDHDGDLVLEHHSQADEGGDDGSDDNDLQGLADVRRRLLSENWDSAVVLTTTVQFFESLFSNKPGRLRKVHNIPGSVIIFDEAQTFPPELLRPLIAMLDQLVADYGCSVVFTTATQPALASTVTRGGPLLGQTLHEIVSDPPDLFRRLKRVTVDWSRAIVPKPLAEVAQSMATTRQALAVVNTKQQARDLYEALRLHDPEAVHLSTRMCAAHRLTVFDDLRERLRRGEPCLVASTQLIEAGVDISFREVWRALAPYDSIAQAAGRCNRNGESDQGRVIVFQPEDGKTPGGAYPRGIDVTRSLLAAAGSLSIDDPETFRRYFENFYNVTDLDAKKVGDKRTNLDFPGSAEAVRLIDDDAVPVLVPWGDGAGMIDRLIQGPYVDREFRRAMDRYMVSLYRNEFEQALGRRFIQEQNGIHYLTEGYNERVGVTFQDDLLVG